MGVFNYLNSGLRAAKQETIVKEKSKWLRRAEAKFERDARREERNKRRAVEDAKLEGDVRHALEVMWDLLLAEERYARLAPKDEEPAKPKRAPDADLVGAPKAVAGETAQWRHETLRWVARPMPR